MKWLAALGGALLAVALFLPWYAYDNDRYLRELEATLDDGGATVTLVGLEDSVWSAWRVFTVIDLVLAAVAILVVVAAFVPRLRLAAALGATVAVGLVIFRIVDHAGPDAFQGLSFYPSPAAGAWLALAGALVAAVAGWASMRGGS